MLLFVNACVSPRGEDSRTLELCEAYLQAQRQRNPHQTVRQCDLRDGALPPFNRERLLQREALIDQGDYSDPMFDMAKEFLLADEILVGAPFWDLSFPAVLRIYIEHISVVGLSYCYSAQGVKGMARAKRLIFATTGGDFEQENSLGIAHWQQLCGLFGIASFEAVFADGLDAVPENGPQRLADAIGRIEALAQGGLDG